MNNKIDENFATNFFMLLDSIKKWKDLTYETLKIWEIINNQIFINETLKKDICVKSLLKIINLILNLLVNNHTEIIFVCCLNVNCIDVEKNNIINILKIISKCSCVVDKNINVKKEIQEIKNKERVERVKEESKNESRSNQGMFILFIKLC